MALRGSNVVRSRRLWCILGVPIAAFVALSAVASVSLLPPAVHHKTLAFVGATTQLYVISHDTADSSLPGGDPSQFTLRAIILANEAASPELRERIAKTAGIRPSLLAVDEPVPGYLPIAEQEPPGLKRANQILSEKDPYRVQFAEDEDLPEIDISAQAPTRDQAVRLARGAAATVRWYLTSLEAGIPALDRLQINQLAPVFVVGDGSGGLVSVAALTFVVALVLWIGLVFSITAVVRDLRTVRPSPEPEHASP
jgi:hypothetical protein